MDGARRSRAWSEDHRPAYLILAQLESKALFQEATQRRLVVSRDPQMLLSRPGAWPVRPGTAGRFL